MKKYAVYPGHMRSKNDGDVHYISADQIMRLYQVKRKECVVVSDDPNAARTPPDVNQLIPLRPCYDGSYTLPIEEKSP